MVLTMATDRMLTGEQRADNAPRAAGKAVRAGSGHIPRHAICTSRPGVLPPGPGGPFRRKRLSVLLRDAAWSLVFNLLNKTQTVAIVVAGLIVDGVVGVGQITTIIAAANLGAGLADFGYSYECGRFIAASPCQSNVARAIRQIPARVLIGAGLGIVGYALTVGIHSSRASASALLTVGVLGGALAASAVFLQVLYSLDRFRIASSTLGVLRGLSGVAAIIVAGATKSVIAVAAVTAVIEVASAGVLLLATARGAKHLEIGRGVERIGGAYLWLGVGSTVSTFVNRSDVLLVASLTNPVALGVYSIASQLENAIESFALAPSAPMLVHAARARASGAPIEPLIRQGRRAALALGLSATALALTGYLSYVSLVPDAKDVASGAAIFTIIACALSSSFVALGGIYVNVLAAFRNYRQISFVRTSSGVVAIAMFVVLAPPFAAPGAACAAVIRDLSFLTFAIASAKRETSQLTAEARLAK
jgi:O-antigen/teichoic acid export membrane protein